MSTVPQHKTSLDGKKNKCHLVHTWAKQTVCYRRPRLYRFPDQRSRRWANRTSRQVPSLIDVGRQQQRRRCVWRFGQWICTMFEEPEAQHVQSRISKNLYREQCVPAQSGHKGQPFNYSRPSVVGRYHQWRHSVCVDLLWICTARQQTLCNCEVSSIACLVQWRCTVVDPGTAQRSSVPKDCTGHNYVRGKIDVSACRCSVQR